MSDEFLLRINAVMDKTGLKRAMLYKLIAAGKFSKPVKLSESCVAWLWSEVEAFIQSRIAASRAGTKDGAS